MAPAIAVLGPIRREGQPVVGCIANRAQDRPPLVGKGSVSFWERYARGNDMPAYLGGKRPESSRRFSFSDRWGPRPESLP